MELKLSFKDKAEFDKVLAPLLHEDFTIPTKSIYTAILKSGESITVVNVKNVPIKEVKDEDGNVIVEAGFHEDWAVDILTEVEIPELNSYLLKFRKSKYHHGFSGSTGNIVLPKPTDSWLKDEIRQWLTDNNIEWNTSLLKAELLELC